MRDRGGSYEVALYSHRYYSIYGTAVTEVGRNSHGRVPVIRGEVGSKGMLPIKILDIKIDSDAFWEYRARIQRIMETAQIASRSKRIYTMCKRSAAIKRDVYYCHRQCEAHGFPPRWPWGSHNPDGYDLS